MQALISPLHAAILGVVEGITEFLPVSSTGHLILTSWLLGLYKNPALKDGVDAFEVVIQTGALCAVFGIYALRVREMINGLLGRNEEGRRLVIRLFIAFLPAVLVGLLAGKWIKVHLFGVGPVVGALVAGGVLMLVEEHWRIRKAGGAQAAASAGRGLSEMSLQAALVIGCAQCVAMWPGTSRSMATILAGLLLGFSPGAAAEFSFLLALPTLSAAAAHDLLKHGPALFSVAGPLGLALGFIVAFIVAWITVKAFIAFLTKRGMTGFGWYRIALGIVLLAVLI